MPSDLLTQVKREMQRNVLRARNGIRLVSGSNRPAVGQTPHDVVWRSGRAELLRYHNDSIRWKPPLLIVFSIVSRAYILDLAPGNSFVGRMLDEGFDVYLLHFGDPDERDAGNTLEMYASQHLGDAITAATRESGSDEINLVGYCFGGMLTLLGMARNPQWPVRSLTVIATPLDSREMGPMTSLVRDGNIKVDDVLDENGLVPANVVVQAFRSLRPTAQITQYADLLDGMWNDDYVRSYQLMVGWGDDQVPVPGAMMREIADQYVRANSLATDGTFVLGGRRISLKDITVPFRSLVAENDSIAPPASSALLPGLVGSADSEEIRLPGGHIGLMVGRTAHKRSIPMLIDFFKSCSEPIEDDR
jgi:polyhydroxyalkanoate synthase